MVNIKYRALPKRFSQTKNGAKVGASAGSISAWLRAVVFAIGFAPGPCCLEVAAPGIVHACHWELFCAFGIFGQS